MVTVKGGVWSNIEDEVLKAAVSKYGFNQWARVSSLIARKTAKQCKARWTEWLDPAIRKIEWSKEEDEKLLDLAKQIPTQWRTIAQAVGRTATQCLDRYYRLLTDEENRERQERRDEKALKLGGPSGGETEAPVGDDSRRLRPGMMDTEPESRPARPDTVDMDEDEKEMLSEARARLANTQGKKAKRKARERQLEESRRLAQLHKRRELKVAGINVKINTRKPGQMDYNADIPFEKAPAPGFHDTREELSHNEHQREAFDPKKQQLSNKRKQDEQSSKGDDSKRRKGNDEEKGASLSQAAIRAAQMQKIREAERSHRRMPMNLPAPQAGDTDLEDLIKSGHASNRAGQVSTFSGSDATRGLVSKYSGTLDATPIRTPRAPEEEDYIANEIRNARARNDTQSILLGEDEPDVVESTRGKRGSQQVVTPNPLATPMRQDAPGATPMRTPRDNFSLNNQTPRQTPGQTPLEIKLARNAARNSLRGKLSALPQAKDIDMEFDIPDEQDESMRSDMEMAEDAALRDARESALAAAKEREDWTRNSDVVKMKLPLPAFVDYDELMQDARAVDDPDARMIDEQAALIIAYESQRFGDAEIKGDLPEYYAPTQQELEGAQMEIALTLSSMEKDKPDFSAEINAPIPHFWETARFEQDSEGALAEMDEQLAEQAEQSNALEKHLVREFAGFRAIAKKLGAKNIQVTKETQNLAAEESFRAFVRQQMDADNAERLEVAREELQMATREERRAQEEWKETKEQLDAFIQREAESLS